MIIKENFDLTEYNSYKVKTKCRRVFFPETEREILEFFKNNNRNITVIGRGNNLIFSKSYYDQDFLILSDNFSNISINGNKIQALAGTNMYDLSIAAYENSLTGFEYFYDIPSSLGGALVMNAGSNGVEIKDFLTDVKIISTLDGKVFKMKKSEINLKYRNSIFQNRRDLLVLSANFKLEHAKKSDIFLKMEEIKLRRANKQPKDFPNAGSVFKRPEGKFVGPMIEALNLKGFRIGGAQVSKKHAGFIINQDNATGNDIIELIRYIQDRVKKEFNVSLEVEQRII